MSKKHFGLLGYPLEHTLSKFIHGRLFEMANVNADYEIFPIDSLNSESYLKNLRTLDGFNITIPYKQAIIQFLDELDERVRICKSVNTVKNTGVSKGYTTDADGFLKSFEHGSIPLKGKVVILGAGGAARAIAYGCCVEGCEVIIVTRTNSYKKGESLVDDIKRNFDYSEISNCSISDLKGDIDIFINATPVGMYPHSDGMPVPEALLPSFGAVFDIVYNPIETKLIKAAKANGLKTITGLPMLVWQAAATQKIWNDSEFRLDDILQLIEDTEKKTRKEF